MKKTLAVFAFAAVSAMAADFKGMITDAACSKGAKAKDADCAVDCIKNKGQAAVLLTEDGKIYKIADQDKVKAHAGHNVTITGKLDGETLKVDSVKM